MMPRFSIAFVLTVGLLSGCGQVAVFGRTIGEPSAEVKPAPIAPAPIATETEASPTVPAAAIQKIKSVALVITPQATVKVADDLRFNSDALLAEITRELQSRKLLDAADSHALAAEIAVDDYAMRPTSNAIVFGNIISAGTLSGTLRLRDERGNDSQNRRIEADARVSIRATGETINPLAPLYHQFAVTTANSLDGTKAKPTIGADQHPR